VGLSPLDVPLDGSKAGTHRLLEPWSHERQQQVQRPLGPGVDHEEQVCSAGRAGRAERLLLEPERPHLDD
jgi:hypothetical protein